MMPILFTIISIFYLFFYSRITTRKLLEKNINNLSIKKANRKLKYSYYLIFLVTIIISIFLYRDIELLQFFIFSMALYVFNLIVFEKTFTENEKECFFNFEIKLFNKLNFYLISLEPEDYEQKLNFILEKELKKLYGRPEEKKN